MSRIFDALRKSEFERSGTDLEALSGAIEVLRRAEHNAGSKHKRAFSVQLQDVEQSSVFTTPAEVQALTPDPGSTGPFAISEEATDDELLSVFSQFQSLQVAPDPQSRLVCLTEQGSAAAEAFRLLSVRLRLIRRDRRLKRLLITSTIPQEGKSTAAANLACTLGQTSQKRTLLLEGDVRRPCLSSRFGIGNNPGVYEWLQNERSLMSVIYRLEGPGFWIMPGGNAPENLSEAMQSARLVLLLDQLSSWFDWIIIDSPPVLPLADTSVWTNLADGILLVTRQGTTERRQLKRGLEAIDPHKFIGALLNGSNNLPHSDYYYNPSSETS